MISMFAENFRKLRITIFFIRYIFSIYAAGNGFAKEEIKNINGPINSNISDRVNQGNSIAK